MTQKDSKCTVMDYRVQIMRGLNCEVRLVHTLGDDGE